MGGTVEGLHNPDDVPYIRAPLVFDAVNQSCSRLYIIRMRLFEEQQKLAANKYVIFFQGVDLKMDNILVLYTTL